jgi:aryl-alcohol dehydrogenase-like predicted oxidoreductase
MQYGTISYVDKPVSRLFFGAAQKPMIAGENVDALLEGVFALGVNAFDCARNYGLAEKSLGGWIRRFGRQEDVVVLSKCGHHDVETGQKRVNAACMYEDLHTSLELLGVRKIDIYILHRDDESRSVDEIVQTFNDMHARGDIGAFGASNWTHARIEQANEYAYAHNLIPFSVSSPNFGLARQTCDMWGGGCVSISGPGNEQARQWYREHKMPVIAYSSLARGFFSGKVKSDDPSSAMRVLDAFAQKGYVCPDNFERLARAQRVAARHGVTVAQIALAFLFASALDAYAVVTTSNPARMQDNIDALKIDLTQTEVDYMDLRSDVL